MFKNLLFLTIFCLSAQILKSAVFTSIANGAFASSSTWTITSGIDADGVPDLDDDLIVNHAVTIGGTSTCASLLVNASGSIVYSPEIGRAHV